MDQSFFLFNNQLLAAGTPVLGPNSRCVRYGEALFETMRVAEGKIALESFHFERLFQSMKLLGWHLPTLWGSSLLQEAVLKICRKNKLQNARVRLQVFAGEGGVFEGIDAHPQWLIECWPLEPPHWVLNENGLDIGVFPLGRKAVDAFSSIKSSNYLLYLQAGRYARQEKLNEALLLNQFGRICDATISNIWWIRGDEIATPPLSEGGIGGTMRRFLLEKLPRHGFSVREKPLCPEELLDADAVFLSNAIRGIRWVKQFGERRYEPGMVSVIQQKLPRLLHQ